MPDGDFELWHALYTLEVRYWYDVDFNDGRNAHLFYLTDCAFAVGENEFRGQDRIREFYAWRQARGTATVRSIRSTRHLVSNLLVEASGPQEAKATGVISFYEAPGRAPVMESKPPILMADLESHCVLQDDQTWRFKSHVLRPVFMGDDVPLSLAFDLSRSA